MRATAIFVLFLLCTGGVSSCTHSTGPNNECDTCGHSTQRADTITVIPAFGQVAVDSITLFKIVPKNFTLPQRYMVKWLFDSIARTVQSKDTISYSFATAGVHTINATLLDSAGGVLAKAGATQVDTVIKALPAPDTTSHNFTWQEFTNVGSESNMTGCWVFGPNCIYANNGWMHRWNGSLWETLNLYSPDPNIGKNINGALSGWTIFGFDTTDYWLTNGSIIYHYTGNGIAQTYRVYYLSHHALHSAWGSSSHDMFFVGDTGTILHFDGTNWTRMSTPTTKDLGSIWGTSDNDIWSVGYNPQTGEAEVLHYDGSSWKEDVLASSGTAKNWGINNVFACDSAGHHIVAALGWTVWRRTDQGNWRSDSGKVPNDIGGRIFMASIAGNASNDIFCAGDYGLIVHWNGANWKRYDQYLTASIPANGANALSIKGNTVCAVGVKNGTSLVLIGQRQ